MKHIYEYLIGGKKTGNFKNTTISDLEPDDIVYVYFPNMNEIDPQYLDHITQSPYDKKYMSIYINDYPNRVGSSRTYVTISKEDMNSDIATSLAGHCLSPSLKLLKEYIRTNKL